MTFLCKELVLTCASINNKFIETRRDFSLNTKLTNLRKAQIIFLQISPIQIWYQSVLFQHLTWTVALLLYCIKYSQPIRNIYEHGTPSTSSNKRDGLSWIKLGWSYWKSDYIYSTSNRQFFANIKHRHFHLCH